MDIGDWSLTASDNGSADNQINWEEFQLPQTVNNSARQMMARSAQFYRNIRGAITTGGAADAYTISVTSEPSALSKGFVGLIKFHAANTGASTFKHGTLTAQALRDGGGNALSAGYITLDGYYWVFYDGTNYRATPFTVSSVAATPWSDGGGTADAITGSYTPAITSVSDGQLLRVRATAANATTTPTFTPNNGVVTARTIKKLNGAALTAGDIVGDEHDLILVYVATGTYWNLINPGGATLSAASTTEVLTGTNTTKYATPDAIAALWEQGSDVASAGTISLGEGGYFNITGTTNITDVDFATDKAGRCAWVKFAGILTFTHNATTLILPTGANITTAAGDTACLVSEGSDVVRCVAYNRASGAALTSSSPSAASQAEQEAATEAAKYVAPATQHFHPGHPKMWARAAGAGTLTESYNMTSVTDTGTGDLDGTIATDFNTATWCLIAQIVTNNLSTGSDPTNKVVNVNAIAAGTWGLQCGAWFNDAHGGGSADTSDTQLSDPTSYSIVGLGDFA